MDPREEKRLIVGFGFPMEHLREHHALPNLAENGLRHKVKLSSLVTESEDDLHRR